MKRGSAAAFTLVALALGALALGIAIYTRALVVPDEWNPWAPLRIDAPLTLLTRYKLAQLDDDPAACLAVLDASAMRYDALPNRETGPGCGLYNAVRVRAMGIEVGEPFALSCPAAVALLLWERHALQPAAQRHLGVDVVRLRHFGSYACRNIYNRELAPRSAHATADALDVAGFTLADGREVRIARDWPGDDALARFLRDAHQGACRTFDGVLGPDYNAAHRDHLHLERGHARVCR